MSSFWTGIYGCRERETGGTGTDTRTSTDTRTRTRTVTTVEESNRLAIPTPVVAPQATPTPSVIPKTTSTPGVVRSITSEATPISDIATPTPGVTPQGSGSAGRTSLEHEGHLKNKVVAADPSEDQLVHHSSDQTASEPPIRHSQLILDDIPPQLLKVHHENMVKKVGVAWVWL